MIHMNSMSSTVWSSYHNLWLVWYQYLLIYCSPSLNTEIDHSFLKANGMKWIIWWSREVLDENIIITDIEWPTSGPALELQTLMTNLTISTCIWYVIIWFNWDSHNGGERVWSSLVTSIKKSKAVASSNYPALWRSALDHGLQCSKNGIYFLLHMIRNPLNWHVLDE